MRLNEHTKIVGKNVILVPYRAKHVEKYHKWMQNPELQALTASEPLTLAQEYEMQKSWHQDADKLTFLIICRKIYTETDGDEIAALIGDTNLFLRLDDADDVNDGDDVDDVDDVEVARLRIAEAEIMIAESHARGKGCGWEAMLLMLKYAQIHLNIKKYEAKIGFDNVKSLQMFEKMQFKEVARSNVFREVTLQLQVDDNWLKWLDAQVNLKCEYYED